MERLQFEGFSIATPIGWNVIEHETTFSDPTERGRKTLGGPASAGVLHVALVPHDPDEPPMSLRHHAGTLARAWGRARGLTSPLSIASQVRPDGVLASAEYQLAGEYVAVFFLAGDDVTLQASYVCDWRSREAERSLREWMVASMTFA